MEEPKLNPEDNNSTELPSELEKELKKEDKVKSFNKFLEEAINQESNEEKGNSDSKTGKIEAKDVSFLQRILNDGFDGISSNPNYKMLGLLIILLINLSLFFVIGNIGKAFLRKAGIM